MKLKLTRAIINAIHSGELAKAEFVIDPIFGLQVPQSCHGVPANILVPREAWHDKASYEATARKLAKLFIDNFTKYADGSVADVRAAGPKAE